MKSHSSEFKQELVKMGKQIHSIITYIDNNNETVFLVDELYAVTPMFKANLLKSVMKELNVESSVDIPLDTVINYQLGLLVNNSYEYIDYGNFVVYKSEKKEDTNTYLLTCYDKMLYAMKDYEPIVGTYPMSIKDYLTKLCTQIDLSLGTATFYNDVMTLPTDLYKDLGYTYRDVLDEIAQATGSIIIINNLDQIEVKYPTNSNDTINEEYLKDINVKFGEKYGPINSIVLSRAGESDNVYIQDSESVQENGLCEVKIIDNQIMNFNDRSDFLQGLLAALNGTEYYLNDFNSLGILYYDVGDYYNIQIGENTYKCLMLNDEINITSGIEEIIYTDLPEESETDYTKSDKTDRKINQTYSIVDKQNQIIEDVVTNVDEQNTKISQVQQTVNELNSKISDIADITTQQETITAQLNFTDINQSEPIEIKIHAIGENISYLYPRDNIYPSDTLYMTDRKLRFTNLDEFEITEDIYYTNYRKYYSYNSTTEEYTLLVSGTDYTIGNAITGTIYQNKYVDYILPDDLLIESNSGTYDELYIGYDQQVCQVTKRCEYNADGTVALLNNEVINNYTYPQINLDDGDYEITLLGYNSAYISMRLMSQNIYTTQFATKAELNTEIQQTTESITSTASATYETKQNAQLNYSQINQTANGISSRVSSIEENKVGKNEVVSEINQSSEAVTINANKIGLTANDVLNILSGNTINMTSKNLVIASNNFNVDKYGNMTCNNASITGGELNITASYSLPKIKTNGQGYMWNNTTHEMTPDGFRISKDSNSYITAQIGKYSDSSYSNIPIGIIHLYSDSGHSTSISGESILAYDITSKGEIYAQGNITSNGTMYAHGFYNTSKEELKKNIVIFDKSAIKIIKDTDIYEFNYKEENENEKRHIGFIIGKNYNTPDIVINNDTIDIYTMSSIMWKAIQEQQEEIEQMKKEIEKLKKGDKK
jgi:hypothetical protein